MEPTELRFALPCREAIRFAGGTLRVPPELPFRLRVRVRLSGRAEKRWFALFTEEQWNRLAVIEAQAEEYRFGGTFRTHVDDSVVLQQMRGDAGMRLWESGDLRGWLRGMEGRELIGAVLAAGAEPGVLEISWLAEAREAVEQELLALFPEELRTKKALAAHMKRRKTPSFPAGVLRKDDLEIAENACKHVFQPRPVVHPPERVEPLDWGADPMDFAQWTIAFNRHGHWPSLARAYRETKQERFAREFVQELALWLRQIPIFVNKGVAFLIGAEYEPGRLSHFLDAGIRLVSTWWNSFEALRKSEAVEDETAIAFVGGVVRQAQYLADDRARDVDGNWGASAAAGLLAAAVMLPECTLAPRWRRIAVERIGEILDRQFYPDGAQIELAPTYQCGAIEHIVAALTLARVNGVPVEGVDMGRFAELFGHLARIATPGRTAPPFNDSPWKPLAQAFASAARLFPGREDFAWFASDGKRGAPPVCGSCMIPYAGYAIMRTGYGAQDVYCAFDAGPFGYSHQHEDKLNLVICMGATVLLTEAGVYNYDDSPMHLHALSSFGHNVVIVDGLPQCRKSKPRTFVAAEPADLSWRSTPGQDYARGMYADGFSDGERTADVAHCRELLFDKKKLRFQITDTLTPQDQREHRYEAIFHFDAEVTLCKDGIVLAEREGKSLRLRPERGRPLECRVVTGQTKPFIAGWARVASGETVPRPAVIFSWTAKGESQMEWMIELK